MWSVDAARRWQRGHEAPKVVSARAKEKGPGGKREGRGDRDRQTDKEMRRQTR